ncbi:hypothetical protein Y1Q_0004960 [Alligator mississippiensis]|uniref:Uncharacterized protein n=1 Tax=Alligator mississippiensis TaxID=8496 RepID=A0A151MYC4_ALLMI|nr:hypothetical protein Y1Q_0004960 [Alligator mississippiensis]
MTVLEYQGCSPGCYLPGFVTIWSTAGNPVNAAFLALYQPSFLRRGGCCSLHHRVLQVMPWTTGDLDSSSTSRIPQGEWHDFSLARVAGVSG